jgi:hypothetical protein
LTTSLDTERIAEKGPLSERRSGGKTIFLDKVKAELGL